MGSKRRALGAGIDAVPAPRRAVDIEQMERVADDLRTLLSEARGVLGDLVRERKAIEKLARDTAEKAIETHVNACLDELNDHVKTYITDSQQATVESFKRLLDDFLWPRSLVRADEARGKRVALDDILKAARTFADALAGDPNTGPMAEAGALMIAEEAGRG